jgi:acyl-CoA hydrolase
MTEMSEAVTTPSRRFGSQRVRTLREAVLSLPAGSRVFLPGSTGESVSFTEALCAEDAPALAITASFVPGINAVPLVELPEGTTFSNLFSPLAAPKAKARAAFRHIPLTYGGFVAHLRDFAQFDACMVHVAPPDNQGRCSLGLAVEFTPLAVARSRRVIAIVNRNIPRLPGADFLSLSKLDEIVECDAPLREYDIGAPNRQSNAIAAHVAEFVQDGAALQIGLGKVPDALLRLLTDRRRLRLQSGMLSDGARTLAEAGSLDPDWTPTSCVHVGSSAYYAWLADRSEFAVRGCDYTHDAAVIASIPGLVAVNSALSVDLFGQANLEMIGGRMISGVGGAGDFAHGASISPGGVSIVALPSTSADGEASRIVPSLNGVCSLPRTDIAVVVTEHGAADLRGCDVVERAERLIEVAAPQHRGSLQDAWRDIVKRL